MTARVLIAVLIYMMVQAVTFGVGIISVLATPLQAEAMRLGPCRRDCECPSFYPDLLVASATSPSALLEG